MQLPIMFVIHFLLSSIPFMILAKSSSSSTAGNHLYKSGKVVSLARKHSQQPRTLVVQIRSDHPVPFMFKNRPNLSNTNAHYTHALGKSSDIYAKRANHHLANSHSHVHHHINAAASQLKSSRLMKPLGPMGLNLKNTAYSPFIYKPLKLKLAKNSKAKLKAHSSLQYKPATSYEVPFKYATANTLTYSTSNIPKNTIESHPVFISDHFAPIYTVPAPNLALHENHLTQSEEPLLVSTTTLTSTPKPQVYHQPKPHYETSEHYTNDHHVLDALTGSQKLYAPDPDPSLPTLQIRPSQELFNQPSINKPLPADVQIAKNQLSANQAQPLVQYVNVEPTTQNFMPQIYPLQYGQQSQADALVAAAVPLYNPTYLVTKSNNLYNQYKQQQLFKPTGSLSNNYANADLTQEVASDGQILQAAKDPNNNNNLQFAALIAAPVLDQQQSIETIPYRLPNVAIKNLQTAETNFLDAPYFNNIEAESSQLLDAFADEEEQAELQRQQEEQEFHEKIFQQQERQRQHQQQRQQLQEQEQQQLEQEQQQQLRQQQVQQQEQQRQAEKDNLQLLFDQQRHLQQQQQQHLQQQREEHLQNHFQQNPAIAAFAEHERLVKQQLGPDTPLRIFVPDESEGRLKKRSDDIQVKGYVDDVDNVTHNTNINDNNHNDDDGDNNHNEKSIDNQNEQNDMFQVTSSIDVSNSHTNHNYKQNDTRSTAE